MPSPDGNYITYSVSEGRYLDERISSFLYALRTGETQTIRSGDGHAAMRWISTNELMLTTWDQFPRPTSRVFRPDHYWLHDPVSAKTIELSAPNRDHNWIGYAEAKDTFFFMSLVGELVEMQRNGTGSISTLAVPYEAPFPADISPDGQLLVYAGLCPNDRFYENCLAIVDLRHSSADLVDVLNQANLTGIRRLAFSPSNRYIALSVEFSNADDAGTGFGIYDLLESRLVYEDWNAHINSFRWYAETDQLVIHLEQQSPDEDISPYSGDLYLFDPLADEWVQLTDSHALKSFW